MKPEVTFFIPVKNGAPFIEKCIGSILSQSFQNWHLFVLDNRSSDNTYSLCSKYLSDQRITYMLNDIDIGMYGNFNKCLDLCDTKYYAILSYDDLYSCDRAVEDSYVILEREPDLCATYSHINWIDDRSRKITTRKSHDIGRISSDKIARKSILSCRNLFGVPLLVRRTAAIGKKYDADLYHTADVELSVAIGRGLDIYVINRPCYSIRFHSRNATAHDDSRILSQMLEIARKHEITLGPSDKIKMVVNNLKMRLGKFVFFMYLEQIRSLGIAKNK